MTSTSRPGTRSVSYTHLDVYKRQGLYTADPHKDPDAVLIREVAAITPDIEALAGGCLLYTSALCVALGVVLPVAFHSIPNAGSVLRPMHIPVRLCGLVCGPVYGLLSGILTPLLSSMITGMPPMAYLPSMLCELAAYGLAAGVLRRFCLLYTSRCV